MKLLLIDTCGRDGSVALGQTEAEPPLIESRVLPGREASERLLPVIRSMLDGAGCQVGDLDGIAVVHGPGSFTGVRIGLSLAKGLSEATGVPLVALSRLAVLAGMSARGGRVHAALDAGRGEVFYGRYEDGRCEREALLSQGECKEAVDRGGALVVCEPMLKDLFRGISLRVLAPPQASDALGMAAQRVAAGAFEDVSAVEGHYLRRTELEMLQTLAARRRVPA